MSVRNVNGFEPVNHQDSISLRQVLATTAHRPWPLPNHPWVGQMNWEHLLFAHWPVPFDHLRPLVPAQLPLDIFDGQCWVGVVPFYMTGVRPRLTPIPGMGRFPELNVRTYVTVGGKPGVYFFSLDITNLLAVAGARVLYKLPYFRARMRMLVSSGAPEHRSVRFRSQRLQRPRPADFDADYGPTSTAMQRWDKDSLAYFLTERYCLYATSRSGGVYRTQIHHLPWPLQSADIDVRQNSMAQACGIHLPNTRPVCHYTRFLRVAVWAPERVR